MERMFLLITDAENIKEEQNAKYFSSFNIEVNEATTY